MKPSRRFPSYTIRNPHSYCFRMIVPKDLRKFVGKTELRYTLNTGSIGLAKSKARLLYSALFYECRAPSQFSLTCNLNCCFLYRQENGFAKGEDYSEQEFSRSPTIFD
jgi:hypothetical protein